MMDVQHANPKCFGLFLLISTLEHRMAVCLTHVKAESLIHRMLICCDAQVTSVSYSFEKNAVDNYVVFA
jgi:hypothetical protein